MKPRDPSEHDPQEREIIEILKALGTSQPVYPPELLEARRIAFLAQVDQLGAVDPDEEVSAGEQEIIKLLEALGSARVEYPAHLLAARRAALLRQIDRAESPTVWDQLRAFLAGIFQPGTTIPTVRRMAFLVASLLAVLLLRSLFSPRIEQSLQPMTSPMAVEPTALLPTSTSEAVVAICQPGDQTPACRPGELALAQDLAYPGNGPAQPAVSSQSSTAGFQKAAYVNDGRGGESWVSNSPDSWIKIDLGKVATINTVSLRKGSSGVGQANDTGQFVIAVALSDVYADGDSTGDYTEYAQVFESEATDLSGTGAEAETIKTQFAPVQARFVKITFKAAGAAIEEVGVFMVEPPVLAAQPTRGLEGDLPATTLIPGQTYTPASLDTAASVLTDTSVVLPTDTLGPANTPIPPGTNTPLPEATATPVPPEPTATALPPVVLPSPVITETIVVAAHDQILTFTCTGHAVEVRGNSNTVTLLGSCSSITVTGNSNQVFWQFGSPVITNRGNDNIVQQL